MSKKPIGYMPISDNTQLNLQSRRGTYFHVIIGHHKYGNFLCMPNHNIGCELADFSDVRWTIGRLSMRPIRKVDAVTVATGISHMEKAATTSK